MVRTMSSSTRNDSPLDVCYLLVPHNVAHAPNIFSSTLSSVMSPLLGQRPASPWLGRGMDEDEMVVVKARLSRLDIIAGQESTA